MKGKPDSRSLAEGQLALFFRSEEYVQLGWPSPSHINYKVWTDRQFTVDFVWLAHRVALEIMGGKWTVGGHEAAGKGAGKTFYKLNRLSIEGWRVILTTPDEIASRDTIGFLGLALMAQGVVIRPNFKEWPYA